MAVTLHGSQSELILTRSGTLSVNNEGMATMDREYACASSYEGVADTYLTVDSEVIDYPLPLGVYNLICNTVTKSRANGVTTYAVNYIGVTNEVNRTKYGTSILSYSKSVTVAVGEGNPVTTQYTGTYAAPTVTKYYITTSGSTVPTTPSNAYDIRVLESYVNGVAGGAPSLAKAWLLSNLTSKLVGTYYIIEATGTLTITG